MADLNVIELHRPLATPIPRSVQSFLVRALIASIVAAAGGALVLLGLLLAVLAAPLALVAIAWVLLRQRRTGRAWALRPAGT